jgi:ABC-type multidrug transport system fused ATPase/permease subunit
MYKDFWRLFIKDYGGLRVYIVIFGITILVALLEGINVSLLVPLVEMLESPDVEGTHWMTRTVASVFNRLGLPLTLGTILLAMGTFMMTMVGLKFMNKILVSKAQVNFGIWIKSTYMGNLLNADISDFHDEKIGALNATMTNQADRATSTVMQVTDFLANLGVITVYLVAAFLVGPTLTAAALAMLILVTLFAQRYIRQARTIGQTVVDQYEEFQVATLESLNGIHLVKSFSLERPRWLEFVDRAEKFGQTTLNTARNQAKMIALHEVALFVIVFGIVFVGVSLLNLQLAVVATLLFVLYRMTPRFSSVNSQRQGLAVSMAALLHVKTAIDNSSTPNIVSGNKPFLGLKAGIELKDVSFSYNESAQVLQDTSFTIEKGKLTAVIGASGAGKTTLMDLVLRLYDPGEGSILVDGKDLRELELPSWRRSIGLVTQDIFLFHDTVANNISLGRPAATPEKVIDAAKRAFAHDFIQQLPQGYDTLVGDRGWNLSGGQRQRIALSRAILDEPEILILDEATSSLDSESEELIHQYMRQIRGACTMLVVAHRLSTIQGADKIVMLQDGKIVTQGDWGTLLENSEVFANYQRLQSIG